MSLICSTRLAQHHALPIVVFGSGRSMVLPAVVVILKMSGFTPYSFLAIFGPPSLVTLLILNTLKHP